MRALSQVNWLRKLIGSLCKKKLRLKLELIAKYVYYRAVFELSKRCLAVIGSNPTMAEMWKPRMCTDRAARSRGYCLGIILHLPSFSDPADFSLDIPLP